MTCINLTAEEKKFLHKCILRLHKESGSLVTLRCNENYSQGNFMEDACDSQQVHEYLIGPLWNTYKINYYQNEGGHTGEIKASLFYLGIIDLIYDSKYPVFKRVCAEIARNEFEYIDEAIADILAESPKELTEELKKEINDAFSKYRHLLGYMYVNIPAKLKAKFD